MQLSVITYANNNSQNSVFEMMIQILITIILNKWLVKDLGLFTKDGNTPT